MSTPTLLFVQLHESLTTTSSFPIEATPTPLADFNISDYIMASQKNHQRPPFRAEHLGSLLRPQKLVDKRVALDGQKAIIIANDKELHSIEDEAIDDIIKLQLDLGYHAVNDGEYRRHQFWGTFFPALEGMDEIENPPLDMFRLYVPDLAAFSTPSIPTIPSLAFISSRANNLTCHGS